MISRTRGKLLEADFEPRGNQVRIIFYPGKETSVDELHQAIEAIFPDVSPASEDGGESFVSANVPEGMDVIDFVVTKINEIEAAFDKIFEEFHLLD